MALPQFSRIRAIIFDLDDTLIDSTGAYGRALERLGILPGNPDYVAARSFVKERLGEGAAGARNRLLYFKAMLESRGQNNATTLLELMTRYETALADDIRTQWMKLERPKLFEALSARYPIVLLTNENLRTQLIKVSAIDPAGKFFKRIITSEEIGFEKPDQRMFSAALRALAFPPDECIMIGDSVETDVMPAISQGMHAIFSDEFTRASSERINHALTIHDLNDLGSLILERGEQ